MWMCDLVHNHIKWLADKKNWAWKGHVTTRGRLSVRKEKVLSFRGADIDL